MSKRLLIITQKVDVTDDLLGFFVAWLRTFSEHFERIDVITLAQGPAELPANVHVHSLGKERGIAKWWQALHGARLLWQLTPKNGGVLCHMSPIFAILAWLFARIRGARLVLWYLHRSNTLRLRLALALCDHLVTAAKESLTVQSSKIVAVGHGIDVKRFAAVRNQDIGQQPLRLLSVGRIAPIKDFGTFIRAVEILQGRGMDVDARIIGRAISPEHRIEEDKLKLIQSKVSWVGFIPYRDMPEQYAWADVVVGCTPRGGIDKALLEGMAAGCVAITSNDAMRGTLEPYANELLFAHGDAKQLADKICAIRSRTDIRDAMVRNVQRYHRLETAIERISALL
jgi:glycosyltransferase involved in cell wall biosynthesis